MATGTAHGAACYATQSEAAAMLCSSVHGVSAAGAVSCVGVSGASPSSGGAASVILTIRTAGSADATMAVSLMECETYSVDYWQPYIAAWVAAAVAIVAAKLTYQRLFGNQSHA